MIKPTLFMSLLLLAICLAPCFAEEPAKPQLPPELLKELQKMSHANQEMLDKSTHLLSITGFLLKFRMQMVHGPDHHKNKNLQQFFNTGAWLSWKKMMADSQMAPIFWSDFFTGGIAMFGPFIAEQSVNAFYNPWWDTVLMLRLAKKGPADKADWSIVKFELLCGEDFRGEPQRELPSIESLFAKNSPLGIVWFTLYRNTLNKFNGECQRYKTAADFMLSNSFRQSSKLPVQVRGAARMAMHKDIFGDHGASVEMVSYLTILRIANVTQVKEKQLFPDMQEFKMFALFTALGKTARDNMAFYAYWGTEKKRAYLFINKLNPKIAVMIYVYAGDSRHFEWYDLGDSAKYLKALEKNEP